MKNRSFCAVALYLLVYYFFFNSLNDVTLCAEPDPCEEAYKKSLKDASNRKYPIVGLNGPLMV